MKKTFLKVVFLLIVVLVVSSVILIILKSEKSLEEKTTGEVSYEVDYNELTEGELIDIAEAPVFSLEENEYGIVFYNDQGIERKANYKGQWVRYLRLSPSQDKLGFYTSPESSITTDVSLIIMDLSKKNLKEVYKGSCTTSGWEWFDNSHVLVYYNCGTECQTLYLIDINSGKKYTLGYGVGYEWSPNKQMVLAYHYSGGPGITVGDKFGKVLFRFIGKSPSQYFGLIEQTKALWSPDSTKIALMIKKEKEEILEIIVFDVKQEFKQIFKEDLVGDGQDIKFFWQVFSYPPFLKGVGGFENWFIRI